jgi:hypothetical protein
MWHFADLRFADSSFFEICGLKTSASPHPNTFFSPSKHSILCSNLNFFVHHKKIINGTTFKTVLRPSCAVFCRNLRICDWRINNKKLRTKKLADLQYRNESKNFWTCDLRTLNKKFACPLLVVQEQEKLLENPTANMFISNLFLGFRQSHSSCQRAAVGQQQNDETPS